MGLNVDEFTIKQLLGAINGQGLGHVHELTAAVIAAAGIALGVFVGHQRAQGVENGLGNDVFRSNEFDLVALPSVFILDGLEHIGVGLGQPGAKENFSRHGYAFPSNSSSPAFPRVALGPQEAGLSYLGDAARMPSALKFRLQENLQAFPGHIHANNALAQGKNIGVVMLARKPRRFGVVAQSGANAGMPVGGNTDADSAAANQNTPPRLALRYGLGKGMSEIRIVHGIGTIGSKV